MKFFLPTVLALLLIITDSFGQTSSPADQTALQYATLITESGMRDKLSILASDALEGRMTGSRGQKMAAAFISHHFQNLGLKGPVGGKEYLQSFNLIEAKPGEHTLIIGGISVPNFTDQFYFGTANLAGTQTAPVVFLGKASTEQISAMDLKGKAVILESATPVDPTFKSVVEKINLVRSNGATVVLVMPKLSDIEFDDLRDQFRSWLSSGNLSFEDNTESGLNVFFVRPALVSRLFSVPAEKLVAGMKLKRPVSISWTNTTQTKIITTENILGFLEGTDKKDEVVVITAHFDHVGLSNEGDDRVFNGADDDGSGTTAVMQLAEAFTAAAKAGNRPRRSILFMTVTGEEEGLFGSEYYVKNPVFPLSNTVVDLNIDMIGRSDPQHDNQKPYVYAIGSDKLSKELHELHESVNRTYSGLALDYTYNDENHPERLYYRSDHWNFAKNNVPIIFYFDGIHADYHKTSDEVSKIDFKLLTERTKLVFHTAWEIANREQRIRADNNEK